MSTFKKDDEVLVSFCGFNDLPGTVVSTGPEYVSVNLHDSRIQKALTPPSGRRPMLPLHLLETELKAA